MCMCACASCAQRPLRSCLVVEVHRQKRGPTSQACVQHRQTSMVATRAKGKAAAAKPIAKTKASGGGQRVGKSNAKENKAMQKLMQVQNNSTITDIVEMLKATPSMILPCYKLLSKGLLVPTDEVGDNRSMLPENNTKIHRISNASLKSIVSKMLGERSDALDAMIEADTDACNKLFLFATGENPDADVFDRDRDTFSAAYCHKAQHHMQQRIKSFKLDDSGGVDWEDGGVFKIDGKKLVHKLSKKGADLPKAMSACIDGWTIKDNWSEHTAALYNEEMDTQISCKKYFKDAPWKFDGHLQDMAAAWIRDKSVLATGSRRVL